MSRMPTIAGLGALVMAYSAALGTAAALDSEPGSLFKVKTGETQIQMLERDGVTPLPGIELAVQAAEEDGALQEARSNEQGRSTFDLAQGRYVLKVNGLPAAVLLSSPSFETEKIRLMVSDLNLLVGGQDEDDEDQEKGFFQNTGAVLLAGGVVAAGILTTIEAANDDDAPPAQEMMPPPPPPPSPPPITPPPPTPSPPLPIFPPPTSP